MKNKKEKQIVLGIDLGFKNRYKSTPYLKYEIQTKLGHIITFKNHNKEVKINEVQTQLTI